MGKKGRKEVVKGSEEEGCDLGEVCEWVRRVHELGKVCWSYKML